MTASCSVFTPISNEDTALQDAIIILKKKVQNYLKNKDMFS